MKRWAEPELARTTRLLRTANTQLDSALKENMVLKNRNEELRVHINRLEADNRDLHAQLGRLQAANQLQGEVIARMEQNQKELLARLGQAEVEIRNLKDRVIQLDAEKGKWSRFDEFGRDTSEK